MRIDLQSKRRPFIVSHLKFFGVLLNAGIAFIAKDASDAPLISLDYTTISLDYPHLYSSFWT